jgi:hypothetical protein
VSERFCPACGVPLVYDPERRPREPARSESQRRARKIKSMYTEGPLVQVAAARHQAEADFIANLLLEEGIPSVTRRSAGFDVPDFLAAGPRDVLVAQSAAAPARDMLLQSELIDDQPSRPPPRGRAFAAIALVAAALVVAVIILLYL